MNYLDWSDRKRTPDFQGMDYLGLAFLPDANSPTSARVSIHLFEAFVAPFAPDDFGIEDGRGRPLPFSLLSQNGITKQVVLEILPPWDAGQYLLKLRGAAGTKRDPFFATLPFTFHIACERGDCRALPSVPLALTGTRPVVDTVTKDYNGFVRLLAEWATVRNSHFADLSPAALERVLLELLAHHGDMTSYYQDRVAAEGFFEDASQRHSLRQHALLLGAELFEGTAAETWLAFDWTGDGFVAAASEVTSPKDSAEVEITFHIVDSARVLSQHSRLLLAAWPGAGTAAIPAGTNEVLLFGHDRRLALGQRLAFAAGELGKPGSFSQVVTVTELGFEAAFGWVADPADAPALTARDVTRVRFEPGLRAPVSPWNVTGAFKLYGNLARARHGQQQRWEPSVADVADPQNAITEVLTSGRVLRAVRLPTGPVAHERVVDVAGRVTSSPLVNVATDGQPWQRVPHLHASAPYDRHYVAKADEDGSLWLEFGDGVQGRVLPAGVGALGLRVSYWIGAASLGNVGAGVLTRFDPERVASEPVVNVVSATEGRDAETKAAARFRVPASLRHGALERAVTLDDYASVAKSVAGVARAVARDIGGPFNAVLLLVDPEGQIQLSARLQGDVEARVDALRMAGREIFVRGPRYVPIELELALCVEPGFLAHRVRQAVLRALLPGATEDRGYFHPDRLSFGQHLELSDLIAIVQRIAGVRSVKALKFRRLLVVGARDVEERLSVGVTEVIRMDGDSTRPENGKLEVRITDLDDNVDRSKFLVAV